LRAGSEADFAKTGVDLNTNHTGPLIVLKLISHGWPGLLSAYVLTAIGLQVGVRLARARQNRLLRSLGMALPVMLGSEILLSISYSLGLSFLKRLPDFIEVPVGMSFLLAIGVIAGFVLVRRRPDLTHKRGTIVLGSEGSAPSHDRGGHELTLGGQSIASAEETKHFKIVGTTGTGKSTAIVELLKGALDRGDRAVFADPDGSYLKRFYNPARGDVILNPFDSRAARWDLFAEGVQAYDAEQMARSLIPDYEGTDRNWRAYARILLTALLRQMTRIGEHDVARLYHCLVLTPIDDLRDLLDATPAGPFLSRNNGKFFDSVRAVANAQLAALEHIARQSSGPLVSVRKWVRGGRGVLFLPYNANEIAALRNLISTWMRLAIFEAMDAQEERDRRLWFVVDELDALGAIDGLKDALTRLRNFGGRCVLGFQSIAQVGGTLRKS